MNKHELNDLDLRIRKLGKGDLTFGGFSVIFAGDFCQYVYVFGFQKEAGPVYAGVSTTPGFALRKDHACTRHVLLTRGMHPQAFGTIPTTYFLAAWISPNGL